MELLSFRILFLTLILFLPLVLLVDEEVYSFDEYAPELTCNVTASCSSKYVLLGL